MKHIKIRVLRLPAPDGVSVGDSLDVYDIGRDRLFVVAPTWMGTLKLIAFKRGDVEFVE